MSFQLAVVTAVTNFSFTRCRFALVKVLAAARKVQARLSVPIFYFDALEVKYHLDEREEIDHALV